MNILIPMAGEGSRFKLKGYDKVRIYGFLAERFMPYWFKSRYEVYENKICYFDTHLVR